MTGGWAGGWAGGWSCQTIQPVRPSRAECGNMPWGLRVTMIISTFLAERANDS
jgi:hypothetical protein